MSLVLTFCTAVLFGVGTWLLLQRRLSRIIIGLGLMGHGANLLMMLSLRTGAPLGPQLLVEEAEKVEVPDAHRPLVDAMRSKWVIGGPDETARSRSRGS